MLNRQIDRYFASKGWGVWSGTTKMLVGVMALVLPFFVIGFCACFCCREPRRDEEE